MNAVRIIMAVLCAGILAACASRGAVAPLAHEAPGQPSLSDLLRPYEVAARSVPAAAAPVPGDTFDLVRSVAVPSSVGVQAFGSTGDATRGTSDTVTQLYAMVAAPKAATPAASQRAIRDGETCYYLVTYLYNVRTGQIVKILSVQFEGCDAGAGPGPGDGGGGGGVNPPPPTTPDNAGCANNPDGTAGKAYAGIGSSNPVFNDPNPNSSAPAGQEKYGYIYTNGSGGYRYDSPTTVNIISGHDAPISQPNEYPGWTPVGLYHTHPHDPNVNTAQIDALTMNHFSQDDIASAHSQGYPIYVAVLDTLAQFDFSESPAVRWYKYDPTTDKETKINIVGSGGC